MNMQPTSGVRLWQTSVVCATKAQEVQATCVQKQPRQLANNLELQHPTSATIHLASIPPRHPPVHQLLSFDF